MTPLRYDAAWQLAVTAAMVFQVSAHASTTQDCATSTPSGGLVRPDATVEHRTMYTNSSRALRFPLFSSAELGYELSSDAFDEWLGARWDDVPERLRPAVVEHIFGVDLITMSTYASVKARYVLERIDPDMRSDFEDVAQDTMIELTAILPTERIRHWKALVLTRLQWQVLQDRRRRTAEKRHPGQRVDYESAVLVLEDQTTHDIDNRLADRAVLQDSLGSITQEEIAAVLRATFVIAADGSYTDVQTTKEVAKDLGISQEKVKRLRAAGVKMLRDALRTQLEPRDTDNEEGS
ncbi:hypothetical protein ACFV24_02630 [Nocardia fluminea]|uniref:hypothetical protein n=1 Tax=Nocardia fluminea TaxID=134984 RepID=UPI00367237DA